ncbi:MAG: SlyX family protein [Bacteriovorax sp.]|nr:SlyX family protein [Bacteriovorax sp.]
MIEERVKDLEVKFSHQDFLLDQLNKIVMNQQLVIDKLQNDILELKLSQSETGAQPRSLEDDVPPHY